MKLYKTIKLIIEFRKLNLFSSLILKCATTTHKLNCCKNRTILLMDVS